MKTALLIDGNSVMYRAYFATSMQNKMTNKNGLNTNCIYSFYNMMYKLNFSKYDYVMIAFDKGKMTKRHDLLPSYKEGRKSTPPELIEQIPYVKALSRSLGALVLEKDLVEADDIVGTVSRFLNEKNVLVNVLSSDKDLLQLVNDKTVVKLTKTGVSVLLEYNINNFKELTGLMPNQIPDLKGLMGDSSDNLKGIPGIGEKTALKLLDEYKTIEGIIDNISDLKGKQKENLENNKDMGLLCKKIATIDTFSEIDLDLDSLEFKGESSQELYEMFTELDFNSVKQRYATNSVVKVKKEVKKLDDLSELNFDSNISYFHLEYLNENYHKTDVLSLLIETNNKIYYIDFNKHINSDILKDYFLNAKKVCFDLKASLVILKKYGITLDNVIFDVLLASYIISPETKDSLESVCEKYSVDTSYDSIVYTKKFDFNEEALIEHTSKKLNSIIDLYQILNEKIKNDFALFDLEMKLSYVLASMEEAGVLVDTDYLKKCKTKYKEIINTLEKEIYLLAGVEFNINSPKQLGVVLFEHLEIPIYKKTKTGSYVTSADVLNKISHYEVVAKVLEYRKFNKLLTTYIEGIEKTLISGKIHTIYKQALTVTGRLSSIEPNMQNLPVRTEEGKEIRQMFISNNGILLGLDYSQIELRVLASLSNDKTMIEAFNNNEDIHSITASKIKNISLSEVTSEDRRIAKAVNFGIIYGQTPFGLSEELNISFAEAKTFITEYFKTYPTIKNYLDSLVSFCEKNGYAKTFYNRKRYISEINSNNKLLRDFARRTSMNAPIQGSAADILKLAMIKLHSSLIEQGLKSKIVLQIHDELILDVYSEELDKVTSLAIEAMQNAVELKVKLTVDYHSGKNLSELK